MDDPPAVGALLYVSPQPDFRRLCGGRSYTRYDPKMARLLEDMKGELSRIPILLRSHAGALLEEADEMLGIFETEAFCHLVD